MPFHVYILRSVSSDKYYVGHTENVDDRLARHNGGRSKATKSGAPWVIVHTERYNTRSEAYQREMLIKSWKSRRKIEELISECNAAG